MKACNTCGVEKADTEFGSAGQKNSDGAIIRRSDCKPCNSARAKAYRKKNPGRAAVACRLWRKNNPEKHLQYERKRKYGITLAQYEAMLIAQHRRCASCGDPFNDAKNTQPHVDHCHATKKVRGVLCYHCNVGIGLFKDSPMRLLLAIRYLQKK